MCGSGKPEHEEAVVINEVWSLTSNVCFLDEIPESVKKSFEKDNMVKKQM